jgi:hypothetical protein
MLRDIFSYLEVRSDFRADIRVRYNLSGAPRFMGLQRALDPNTAFAGWARRFFPPGLLSRIRHRVMRANLMRSPLDPLIRSELVEVYRADIMKTQDLIGRDLTHWLA